MRVSRVGLWVAAVMGAAFGCSNDRPTKESIDAHRAAQQALDAKIGDARKAFEAAAAEIEAGKWVPREDLGKCRADLPERTESGRTSYDMMFVSANRTWADLTDALFDKLRAGLGKVAATESFTSEEELKGATRRLKELDVDAVKNALVGVIDESVAPKEAGKNTFTGGHERGRLWLWSFRKRAVLCASVYEAKSSDTVEVFENQKSPIMDTNKQLSANLFGESREASVKALLVAGPPK